MKITWILPAIFIVIFQGCLFTESTPSNSDTETPNPSDTLAIDTLPNDTAVVCPPPNHCASSSRLIALKTPQ